MELLYRIQGKNLRYIDGKLLLIKFTDSQGTKVGKMLQSALNNQALTRVYILTSSNEAEQEENESDDERAGTQTKKPMRYDFKFKVD